MKRTVCLVLLIVLLVSLLVVGASETLTNRSGRTATGVIVTFSDRVRITSYDDSVFATQEPLGRADQFTFNGGELEHGGRFRLTWSPSSASIVDQEWINAPGSIADEWYSSGSLSYEEIMAQIAQYPGPDEPLYVPAEDEAIWLTDLEGHAAIYDNDSIRINYAAWFDQSQVTRIEVYRNGIKMRFLPDLFDVLTNEQMKTFDGNPLEHTPASDHTDHAIFGYVFRIEVHSPDDHPQSREKIICSPVRLDTDWRVAALGNYWYGDMPRSEAELRTKLVQMVNWGFNAAQVDVNYFMASKDSNEVFAQYVHDPRITPTWARTTTRDEIVRIIRAAEAVDLKTELRIQLCLSEEFKQTYPVWINRSGIAPSDVDKWFRSYGEVCLEMAQLAEEESVEVFCVAVELNSMEKYAEAWTALIRDVRGVFSGLVTFSESTHHYLHGFNTYSDESRFSNNVGDFWDACDAIEMNCYPLYPRPGDAVTLDPRMGDLAEGFVETWARAFAYYREHYPGKPLWFGEIGTSYRDGTATYGTGEGRNPDVMDIQEFADTWAAYLLGCSVLQADGFAVWAVRVTPEEDWMLRPGEFAVNYTHVIELLSALIK